MFNDNDRVPPDIVLSSQSRNIVLTQYNSFVILLIYGKYFRMLLVLLQKD